MLSLLNGKSFCSSIRSTFSSLFQARGGWVSLPCVTPPSMRPPWSPKYHWFGLERQSNSWCRIWGGGLESKGPNGPGFLETSFLRKKYCKSNCWKRCCCVPPEGVCMCVRHSYVICGVQRCGILLCALGKACFPVIRGEINLNEAWHK